MDVLNTTSDQWFIEIETYIVPQATYIIPQTADSQFHNKINFAILDQNGYWLTSSMQSKHYTIRYANRISMQTLKQTFFHTVDIKKMKQNYPISKYIAIRLYTHSSIGQPLSSQHQGKLRLIPISIFGNVELIQEKCSSVPTNEIVLNNISAGEQRRIGNLPNGMVQRHSNSTSTNWILSTTDFSRRSLVRMHNHTKNSHNTIRSTG